MNRDESAVFLLEEWVVGADQPDIDLIARVRSRSFGNRLTHTDLFYIHAFHK